MTGRLAPRTDGNHKAVIKALRDAGASVASTHGVHKGFPDCVVGIPTTPGDGETYLVEIKDGAKTVSRRTLTPDQVKFVEQWKGSPVVILLGETQAREWVQRVQRRAFKRSYAEQAP